MKRYGYKAFLILLFVALCVPVLAAKKNNKKKSGKKKPVKVSRVVAKKKVVKPKKKQPVKRKRVAKPMTAEQKKIFELKRKYEQLAKNLEPATGQGGGGYTMARAASGIVPLGFASAAGYQLLRGKPTHALGLGSAAVATSAMRTYMLRSMLRKGAQAYHKALYEYLAEWPAVREDIPETIRSVIDPIYEDFSENEQHVISPEHALALSDAVKAIGTIEKARASYVSTDKQKWDFVLEQLGMINAPPNRILATLPARVIFKLMGANFFAGIWTWYMAERVGPIRRYIHGRETEPFTTQHPLISKADMLDQQRTIKEEWPAKMLGWTDEAEVIRDPFLGVTVGQRSMRYRRAHNLLHLSAVAIPVLALLVRTAGSLRTAAREKEAMFDTFVSIWPSVKQYAPAAVHERFDDLYENNFDKKENKVTLEGPERKVFLAKIREEGLAVRKGTKKPKRGLFARRR